MNRIIKRVCILFLSICSYSLVAQTYPFRDKTLSPEDRVEDLISQMTIEEKIDLLAGYRNFHLHPCERLGIPSFHLADGPLGIASWGIYGRATCFPSTLSLASSWNTDLVTKVGDAMGQEWRSRGIHFMLAPGVNVYRSSKGARNFEYMGEDPYLASRMVVNLIKAVQNREIIATVKHYAANDQEFDRYRVSSEISERTLREICLPAFEAAVKEAGVKAVMTGYNPVNGVYCTENSHLIDILKKEWGFKYMLMSDWDCTFSINAAYNGLDMEMGSYKWLTREKLLKEIEEGRMSEDLINEKVRRIYLPCFELGFFDRDQKDETIPTYNNYANEVAYEAACEGIILLKNEDEILPLSKKSVKKIAVIGPNASYKLIKDAIYDPNALNYGGGGSSRVHSWYAIDPLQGIKAEFPEAEISYCEAVPTSYLRNVYKNSVFQLKTQQVSPSANEDSAANLQSPTDKRAAVSINYYGDGKLLKTEQSKNINFLWPEQHNQPVQTSDNQFTVSCEAVILSEKDDKMNLFVKTQGGFKLYVDGELKADKWESKSYTDVVVSLDVKKGQKLEFVLEYKNNNSLPAELRMGYGYASDFDFSEPLRLAAEADVVVFCAGVDGEIEKEGMDRPFELPFMQAELIKELAKVNESLIVSLNVGGGVEIASWEKSAKAILHLIYPGMEGGRALSDILSGDVNPSAKLPFTVEKEWKDAPAYGSYDETRDERKVYYNEGVFVGYRGYEKNGVEPLYPFGFGLSYTSWKYSDIQVEKVQDSVVVSCKIKNIGKRAGGEIVQLYVSDEVCSEERPIKELKSFKKVFLKPGRSSKLDFVLPPSAFSFFSEKAGKWVLEPGKFKILIGSSSKDIRLETEIEL